MKKRSVARVPRQVSGPVTLAVYVGAVLAPVFSPASAQTDEDIRHMTVMQRPRETYDARGIPVGGGFTFLPSATVTETYDDNILGSETNAQSDFITIMTPRLELRSNWARHSLDLKAYGRFNRFMDNSNQNSDEYGASGDLGLDVGHGGAFTLNGSYDRATIDRNAPDANRTGASFFSAEQVDVTQGTATYTQTFSHLLLGASANVVKWDETREIDKIKDRTEYTGSVRVGYVFSPALNVFVEPAYLIREFDVGRTTVTDPTTGIVTVTNPDHNSQVLTISGGVAYDITGILYGETTVGWYRAKFDEKDKPNASPGFQDASGISVRSTTTYNVTARDSLILTAQRSSDVTTQIAGAGSDQRTSVNLELQHELTRNIVLQANVGYADEDYIDSTPHRDDSVYTAGIHGDYLIDRHFAVYAEYAFFKRDSNTPGNSTDDNRIGIGIKVQL